jgi:hypothetical protein
MQLLFHALLLYECLMKIGQPASSGSKNLLTTLPRRGEMYVFPLVFLLRGDELTRYL